MKFGGTSMGSAERMQVAAGIIAEQRKKHPVIVVVSAMSKVTDLLLETLRRAEDASRDALLKRHVETCEQLLGKGSDACKAASEDVQLLVSEFQRIAGGVLMLGERPPRSVDEAIAVGERLSASILARYLDQIGTRAIAVNAADVIVTDAIFGNASPQMDATKERCTERLLPQIEKGIVPVVTGFNGATIDGRPTTLGRGGSDFSASILAAVLDAHELWIWTDVDGIMTADPRVVKDVAVLDELTYAEAAELAYNGAKVLHPRTLAPLVEKRIPVWSKNSFAPHKPGSKIVSHFDEPKGARAVTSMSSVAMISMEPANALLSGTRLMARTLDALALANVEILVFTSSSYRQTFCFLIRKQDENVGLLAVVGEGMRGTPGLAGRVFTAISREEINIIAIAQGSSELTIGIIVRLDRLDSAVRAVHEECQLGKMAQLHRA
jgi:aspartate kinase